MSGYRLRAIRLVNFHNFIDETIEVRAGGHLFLLGDNGSGKTTVLDAVHLVLAGGELELNAAARIGGRRDGGRTLQGIVLRYDPEHGVRNQGGAIAYAALELVEDNGGRVLSLGVGVEATTMDARVARWGFVIARPLAEVSLVDDERRPRDRDGLRRQLGATHVHAPLAGYRKELARRLFGSEAQYDEAVRFWAMAKAYREIVAGARDFGALFERLLPAPDGAVFDEILKTLRALDDLEVALRELDGQRAYVGGLADRVRAVAVAHEAAARYRWLACQREREEALAEGAREAEAAAELRRAAERRRQDADLARLRAESADDILRRASSDDTAGVLGVLRATEPRRRLVAVELERARGVADDLARDRDRAAVTAAAAREAVGQTARRLAADLRTSLGAVAELPGELAATARLVDELARLAAPRGGPIGDGPAGRAMAAVRVVASGPEVAAALAELDSVRAARARAVLDARVRGHDAARLRATAAATVTELEAAGPSVPTATGAREARRALADAGIAAQPLYELLDPRADVEPTVLAAIESLAGDAVLGALVVTDEDRARARALVAAVAPGLRVVVATCAVELPAWCAQAFVPSAVGAGARSALAAALDQPSALGPVAAPSGADVALRGLGHRVERTRPRWLGAEARRLEHERRLDAARAALADAERVERAAADIADVAQRGADRASHLARVLAAGVAALAEAWPAADVADHRAALTAAAWRDADARAAEVGVRLEVLDGELAALRARIGGVDLAQLEQRLATLRGHADRARQRWHELVGAQADATAAASQATARSEAALGRAADLAAGLDHATGALRQAIAGTGGDDFAADDDALAHHVRVTLRGDSFRSLDTLRQRIADEDRAADLAAAELDGDGSRGVRNLAQAGRFGFGYDPARNQIEDRRGQPLDGVLAELDRTLAEQRSVVNERTRALMDGLVMGELARHLQAQVHHLHETITGINRVLRGLRFGPSEYQFELRARPDRTELLELVRRLSILDEDSRHRFRTWVDVRKDELRATDEQVPALLDYRRWFEFKLKMSTTDAAGVELTDRLRVIGSGGEQGVPNYLLVLALAKLMFDAAGAAIRPLLFDEAFYGIDAGRKEQLLRLATDLGLQLLVASPDQDGATPAVRFATTLFVVKDADHDVHLAPYHYWNHGHDRQPDLFAAAPPAPDLTAATCRTP